MGKRTLGEIIRWFKGRCTFEINRFQNKIYFQWQSRFHDHIIRNENSLSMIRRYIRDNPINWFLDRNNSDSDPKGNIIFS